MLILNSSDPNQGDDRFYSSELSAAKIQLKEATSKNLEKTFLNYCDVHIKKKDQGELREEEVGYNICGCLFLSDELSKIPHIEEIIDHACTMELPRESSIGCGISIGDPWSEELAAKFKDEEWQEFIRLVEKAKSQYKE